MRSIVNVSLPKELNKFVDREVKKGKFASKSEFFRSLLRYWQQEEKLLEEIKKSEREFSQGKGNTLKSLKGLR